MAQAPARRLGDRDGRTDRHLRLRGRWTHRRPRGARPAAARAGPLRRRHRARSLRPAADRRGPRLRPRRAWTTSSTRASSCSSSPATARARPSCATRASGTPYPWSRSSSPPYVVPCAPRATAGSASSAPRRRSRAAPTTTPSPRPPTSPSSARRARGSSSSSRPASPAAPSCWRWRTTTSTRSSSAASTPLVLGCTHYPLLTGVISYVMGEDVTLVSSAEETAKDVYRALVAHGLERDPTLPAPTHRFLATGDPAPFAALARRFLGPEIGAVEHAHRGDRADAPDRSSAAPAASRVPTRPPRATSSSTTGHRVVLDLGNGALGALQRYTDAGRRRRRGPAQPPARRPLPRPHVATTSAPLPAAGPAPSIPVLGPTGTADRMAAAYDLPDEPGMTGEFDFRDHVAQTEIGPFRVMTARGRTTRSRRTRIRVEAGGRSLRLQRRHRRRREALVELSPRRDLALFEAAFVEPHENHPPDLHLTATRGRRPRRPRRRRPPRAHPPRPVDPAGRVREEAAAVYAGDLQLASPASPSTSDPSRTARHWRKCQAEPPVGTDAVTCGRGG